MIPGLRQRMCRMSLKRLAEAKRKEMLWKGCECVRRVQEPTRKGSQQPKLEQFEE